MGGSKVVESGVDGRLLELETKYASLRRAYLALDADLEELIEKGYRKMHRYRMVERIGAIALKGFASGARKSKNPGSPKAYRAICSLDIPPRTS
jgi:hypothetical protein